MGNLYQELQRRKVFRVGAVYAIVAWLIIEVAGEILPTFDAPQWVNQTIILVLVLGWPLALVLAWAFEMTPQGIKSDAAAQPAQLIVQSTDRKLIYAILGLVLLVAGFQVSERFLFSEQGAVSQPPATAASPQNSPVIRFTVPVGEETELYLGGVAGTGFGRPSGTPLALSNDGNLLVYAAWEEGPDGRSSRLYSRRLDQQRAEPIAGTEDAAAPFLSPDGEWIGFVTVTGQSIVLRRVPVTGGNVETVVADAGGGQGFGYAWGDDGTIVYGGRGGLYQVPASGGNGELLATANSSMGQFFRYGQPHLLPGSKVLLFHGVATTRDPERAEIIALDLSSRIQTTLLTNAMNPLYVAETGHLLFMRQGSLMAVRFDPDQLVIEGDPVLIEADVMQALSMPDDRVESGAAQLAVSASGHLAYARGGLFPNQSRTLMRVTGEGETEAFNSVSLENFNLIYLRMSPDSDRLAFLAKQGAGNNIFVHDFVRDTTQQLITGGYRNTALSWSPDGESIAFSSNREDNVFNLYRMPRDGSGEQPERLAASDQNQFMMSWSSDGVIAYLQGSDIWMLPPDGEPAPFFTSEGRERYATFSPDGKWLAYTAGSSRGNEVYIRPYPGPGPAVLISGNGSEAPAWSRDGTQLYFLQRNVSLQGPGMMVVDIADGRPSPARLLIEPWPYMVTDPARSYDVLEEGGFIAALNDALFNEETGRRSSPLQRYRVDELQVVLNFVEVLRQRVAE